MARYELRIHLFEAHSHFQSIANPHRSQIPPENSKNKHFPKDPKIKKSGIPLGVGGNGRSPFNISVLSDPPDVIQAAKPAPSCCYGTSNPRR